MLWVRGPREDAWVLSEWIAAALALVGYSFAAAARGWPTVVPRHHVLFYLRVAQPVLIGYGASALWSAAGQWLDRSRLLAKPRAALTREPAKWVVTAGGALLLVLATPPAQARRAGPQRTGLIAPRTRGRRLVDRGPLALAVGAAGRNSTVQSGLDAYRWMRSALRPDDVVLATDERALMVVGPAGAKVVVLEALFGNVSVDHRKRAIARDEMFAALRRGDEAAFEALADEYSVTHVLWVRADGPWFDPAPFRSLALAFDNGKTRIYRRMAARGRLPDESPPRRP